MLVELRDGSIIISIIIIILSDLLPPRIVLVILFHVLLVATSIHLQGKYSSMNYSSHFIINFICRCFKGKDCRFSHDLTANPQSDHTNIPDSSVRSSTDISDTTSSAAESSSTTATTMDSATDMCSICLEEVAPNKFGLLVNCSHVFCLGSPLSRYVLPILIS